MRQPHYDIDIGRLSGGHTNIELPYSNSDFCIRILCEWQDDKLLLKEKYGNMEAGAEILAIEGMRIDRVFDFAESVIPHENEYLVKSRMVEYPYKNYHIFSERNLNRLFGRKTHYEVTFRKEKKEIVQQCVLVKYDGFLDFRDDSFIYYEMQENRMILHLDRCVCDDKYRQTLTEVASLCKEKNIEILELDLSKNMGGSSADTLRMITSRKEVIENCRKEILFPKNIVCRVSNTTFSSARTFAVTLKDNQIATIIGQPTGGKPCSYGMPRRDRTPNCNIPFRVSRCLFLRPDNSLDDEVALVPKEFLNRKI